MKIQGFVHVLNIALRLQESKSTVDTHLHYYISDIEAYYSLKM